MQIRRPLIAASLAAFIALAGCSSSEGESTSDTSASPSASDPADPNAPPEPPEADLDGVPEVVAQVNGEEITLEEFTKNYEGRLLQAAQQAQMTGQEVNQDDLKKQVADQMVDTELLVQAAHAAGIKATDKDIDTLLDDLAKQNQLPSRDEFIKVLAEQGLDEEQVREQAAQQFAITSYLEAETTIKEPTDKELRKQYDALGKQAEEQAKAQGGEGQKPPPFKEVKAQLAQQATSEQQGIAAQKIVDGLRESGDVTINL